MILVVGLSHRTAPVDVREKFATSADALPEVLARLASKTELREVLFLSTCNRVEVFATGKNADSTRDIREALAAHASVSSEELAPFLYGKSEADAVRHIFRVAASLDSMVLGEPQILGQMKDAYDAAMAASTLGNYLGRCVNRAFTVAKRVRTETSLGAGLVSISSVAVDLARQIFGDLKGHGVLLLGAGEMAEAAAKSLGKGGQPIRVCNRSFERGEALAKTCGGEATLWSSLEAELVRADVVVASTASPTFVVTYDLMKRVMKARKGRTLFLIDIAVPRNVDPKVHSIDNAHVFNVDDLEKQVAESMKARQSEVIAAEKIVAQELIEFDVWSRGLDVQPTIVALRARTRAVLIGELERSIGGRLKHLTSGDRAALHQMMESAVNKLLHAPTTRLKTSAASDAGADFAEALKHLFDLRELAPSEDDGEPAAEKDEDDEHLTH